MMRNTILLSLLFLSPGSFVWAEPKSEPLTSEQVGKVLKDLGYQPELLTPDVWQVSITRDTWKVHIMVSLTPDAERIWLECKFAAIPDPELIPASAWLKLLMANERIGPAYFAFDKADGRIHLYKAFDNPGAGPGRLRKELDAFDAIVRKTQNVWRSENFSPAESLPLPPRVVEPESPKAAVEGSWRIVRIETKGESVGEEKLSGLKPTVVIRGDRGVIKTGLEPERTVSVRTDATAKPATIDFIDENGRVEAGIYVMETGLLTLCVASVGEARPRQFVTDPKNKFWLLVLKRAD